MFHKPALLAVVFVLIILSLVAFIIYPVKDGLKDCYNQVSNENEQTITKIKFDSINPPSEEELLRIHQELINKFDQCRTKVSTQIKIPQPVVNVIDKFFQKEIYPGIID